MKYTSTSSLPLSQRLFNEYGNFLGQTNWTFYCTLSTQKPLSVKSAQRYIERTHEQLQTNYNLETQIFWVAELVFNIISLKFSSASKVTDCPDTDFIIFI